MQNFIVLKQVVYIVIIQLKGLMHQNPCIGSVAECEKTWRENPDTLNILLTFLLLLPLVQLNNV
jgi:hypothetical protein